MNEPSGALKEQFETALRSAFRSEDELARMVQYRMDVRLSDEVASGSLKQVAYGLIDWACSRGRFVELVEAARASNPDNPGLKQFAEQLERGAGTSQLRVLEGLINARNAPCDVLAFLQRLQQVIKGVCRIEIDQQPAGTGFLVGPEAVLTNHHVLGGAVGRERVTLRFDYVGDGRGVEGALHRDWLLDGSPPEQLDHALVRLAAPQGSRPVITLPREPRTPSRGDPVFVVQHPSGERMQLAFDVVLESGRDDRIRYRANTERGSSGSPCFDGRLELIAVHHASDAATNASFNEGILIGPIRKRLESRGLAAYLS